MPAEQMKLTEAQIQEWAETHCENCGEGVPRSPGAFSVLCARCATLRAWDREGLVR